MSDNISELQVLKSAAGYYIGRTQLGEPYSRKLTYFKTKEEAEELLKKYENTPDIINDTITLSKNKVRKYRSNQGKSPERNKISYKVCFYLGIITILILVSYAIFIQL